jgi:hypothetical protein
MRVHAVLIKFKPINSSIVIFIILFKQLLNIFVRQLIINCLIFFVMSSDNICQLIFVQMIIFILVEFVKYIMNKCFTKFTCFSPFFFSNKMSKS